MSNKSGIANIAGLILAGGYSSRMGSFKPLLSLGEKTVVETAVESFRQGGIKDIRVVVGYRAEELIPLLRSLQVSIIVNHKYADGMFSSIVAGVTCLACEAEAFLLLPGDVPLIRRWSIRELLHTYRKTKAPVIYPVFNGRRGHPPLVGTACFESILNGDGEGGLQKILANFEYLEAEVPDAGILLDMDTPTEYQTLIKYVLKRHIPTYDECVALLRRFQTDSKVLQHGQVVANVGRRIAYLMKQKGVDLDSDLIAAAAIVHDLAKGRPHHAQQGAKLLSYMGFPHVAGIVAAHMQLEFTEDVVNETAIVFLADKLVKGKNLVSIDERFSPALKKFANQPAVLNKILQRKKTAQQILDQVESLVGKLNIILG